MSRKDMIEGYEWKCPETGERFYMPAQLMDASLPHDELLARAFPFDPSIMGYPELVAQTEMKLRQYREQQESED